MLPLTYIQNNTSNYQDFKIFIGFVLGGLLNRLRQKFTSCYERHDFASNYDNNLLIQNNNVSD